MTARRLWAMLTAFALVAALGALAATPTAAQPDPSAAARCFEHHKFGAEPVDVAKSADGRTVLAQVNWDWHQTIGCYLTLDDTATKTLRAAPPPPYLPDQPTDDSQWCFGHHRFGEKPVDVAKSADNQAVLARLVWNRHATIGCYLTLDNSSLATLRAAHQTPDPAEQFTAISTGHDHACGIRTDKTVACWGDYAYPDAVPDEQFTAIAAGGGWTCGITTDKTLQCWGWGYTQSGEAGEAFRQANEYRQSRGLDPFPYPVVPAGQFMAVAASAYHACGIRTDNTAVCWGNEPDSSWEVDVPPGKFTVISSGIGASCGIRTNKTIQCWGSNDYGEIDDLNSISGQFITISVSSNDAACGIRTDNTTVCWGQLAFGPTPGAGEMHTALAYSYDTLCTIRNDNTAACTSGDPRVGHLFEAPKGQFAAISPGANLACGIKTDSTVVCWGPLWLGEANPPAGPLAAIAAGGRHSCAIRIDQTLVCWGANVDGRSNAPDGQFTAITAGYNHSCGIKTDNTALCWGSNTWGSRFAGQSIVPAGQFTAITAGGFHTCAIRTDHTAVCWGNNEQGQTDAPAGQFTAITAGFSHSCAIRTDHTAVCWDLRRSVLVPDGVQWVLPGSEDLAEILAAEAEMARLVSELRQGLGLARLSYSAGVASVARGWSRTMRNTGQFIHNPIYLEQYPPGATLGRENIATVSGPTLLEAVQVAFDGLVASPGHYANMTSTDINTLGVGIAFENNTLWLTQNFAYYP